MGRAQRPRPIHLAEKLLQLRLSLGLTQQQMLERLDYRHSPLAAGHISDFELGRREPPLPLLLRYARMAEIALEILADDELALPPHLLSGATPSQAISSVGRCPYCGAADRQIKAGRNRSGSVRYQCRCCFRHYTPEPAGNNHLHRVRRHIPSTAR